MKNEQPQVHKKRFWLLEAATFSVYGRVEKACFEPWDLCLKADAHTMELLKTSASRFWWPPNRNMSRLSSEQLTRPFFCGEGGDDLLPSYVGIIIKTHGSRGISRDPGMNKPGSLWLNHKASFHGFRTPWRQSKATWYSHAVLDHFLNFVSNSQAAKSQREAPSSLKKNSGQISTGSMFFFQGLAKSQLAGSLEKRILT